MVKRNLEETIKKIGSHWAFNWSLLAIGFGVAAWMVILPQVPGIAVLCLAVTAAAVVFLDMTATQKFLSVVLVIFLAGIEYIDIQREQAAQNAKYAALQGEVYAIRNALDPHNPQSPADTASKILGRIGEYQEAIKSLDDTLAKNDSKFAIDLKSTRAQVAKDSPRDLTDDQQRILTKELVVPEGHIYTAVFSTDFLCLDCNHYANRFIGVFQKASGWQVGNLTRFRGAYVDAGAGHPGITLLYADQAHSSPSGSVIEKAFRKAGIRFNVAVDPTVLGSMPPPQRVGAPAGTIFDPSVEVRIDTRPGS